MTHTLSHPTHSPTQPLARFCLLLSLLFFFLIFRCLLLPCAHLCEPCQRTTPMCLLRIMHVWSRVLETQVGRRLRLLGARLSKLCPTLCQLAVIAAAAATTASLVIFLKDFSSCDASASPGSA